MNATEISSIKDGDSIIINGIDTVFQGGVFYSSDMELRVMDTGMGANEKVELADYHLNNLNWQKFYTLRLNRLMQDAERDEKYSGFFKRLYTVERGGKMTLEEKARIGKINEDIYGNS